MPPANNYCFGYTMVGSLWHWRRGRIRLVPRRWVGHRADGGLIMGDSSAGNPPTGQVLVVAQSSDVANTLADGVATHAAIEAETASLDTALRTVNARSVDCVVVDRTSGLDDADLRDRVHDHPDVLYVPLVDDVDRDTEPAAAATPPAPPLPKPPTNRLDVLGAHIAARLREPTPGTADTLQRVLWELTDELMAAPTREAIVELTCEALAGSDHFRGAWVEERPPETGVWTAAGVPADRIREIRTAFDAADRDPPWTRAVRTRTGHRYPEPDADPAVAIDHALVSVPLLHRGIVYGVLSTVRREPDDRAVTGVRDALVGFGKIAGQALAMTEMQTQGETVQQAIEQADPAIAILDEDGTVEYVNAAFETVYGYPKSETIGASVDLLLPSEVDSTALLSEVGEGTHWREEIVKYGKGGRRFHADLSVASVPVAGGTRQKYVAVASDITALKERGQRLEVLNRVLRHNLRNDMDSIIGRAELIASADSEDPTGDAARIIETASDLVGMGEKVRRAVTALDESAEQTDIALAELLERVASDFADAYPAGDVIVDVPPDVVVESNWRQLELAVSNLVENGLEHGGSNPTVEILLADTDANDETISIAVRDDGPGIPTHELRVLEAGEETALEHGSGIGLWLVHAAATTIGGDLSFDTGGDGTTVTIDIPRTGRRATR